VSEIQRESPVVFDTAAARMTQYGDWPVAARYAEEAAPLHLIDLCHRTRWDLQDRHIDRFTPFGCRLPEKPGTCRFENGWLVSRLNRTQVVIWHLAGGDVPPAPDEDGYTDITEAQMLVAITGSQVWRTAEKLSSLDFEDPRREPPFVLQGPFCHVTAQAVVLERQGADGTLLVALSRGYSHSAVHAILEAGAEFGMKPGGADLFKP